MLTRDQARRAAAASLDGVAITAEEDLGDAWAFDTSDGRRYVVTLATGAIEGPEFEGPDALARLATGRGGYDQAGAVARIRARLGTASDAETIRRCVATVDEILKLK
jgi:hypothetical protein